MSLFLRLSFLFFLGSVGGWVAELLFRRFLSSANPQRKWINPGFCVGPYLPLYGVGLCLLYLIASVGEEHLPTDILGYELLLVVLMGGAMTLTEYVAGVLALKVMKVRLWDYSGKPGNIQGIICPKFSAIWLAASAVYYYLIHPYILGALKWLSENLAFSFVIGLFFGIFIADVVYSTQLVVKFKQFAEENDVIVKLENIKANIRRYHEETKQRYHFFRPLSSDKPLADHLRAMRSSFESRKIRPSGKQKKRDKMR